MELRNFAVLHSIKSRLNEAMSKIVKLEALIAATLRYLLFREWRRTVWKIYTNISGDH